MKLHRAEKKISALVVCFLIFSRTDFRSQPGIIPRIISKVLRMSVLVALPITAFVAILPSIPIYLIYDTPYMGAVYLTSILAIAAFFSSVNHVMYSSVLLGTGKTWQNLAPTAAAAAAALPMAVIAAGAAALQQLLVRQRQRRLMVVAVCPCWVTVEQRRHPGWSPGVAERSTAAAQHHTAKHSMSLHSAQPCSPCACRCFKEHKPPPATVDV